MPQKTIFEELRLSNLFSYDILDSAKELRFDHLIQLANAICGTECSVISLIDSERQWFKAKIGIDVDETDRSLAFCSHTIEQNEVMEVTDARNDERFKSHPYVVAGDLLFYAGAPLRSPEGYNLGTLCVFGDKPRSLSAEQKASLKILAGQAMELIQLRKLNKIIIDQQELLLHKTRLQSIGELAGGVCHQINNPLAIIKGRAMILRHRIQEALPKDHLAFTELEVIESTIDRLASILKALRVYSIDFGNVISEVRVHEVLEDALILIQSRISKEGVILNFDKGPDIKAKVNKNQVVQILVELISNALDSLLESDEKVIDIKVENRNQKVVMTVSDSGKGIKQAESEKVFEAFYSTKPRHFGVGLYNVKNFVAQHDGEIKLVSLRSPTIFEVVL